MTGDGAPGRTSLHATAVVHGESGVLILGPSGSGKSALALALMARASSAGAFGALIGDDRIFVRKVEGQLVASGAANMAGDHRAPHGGTDRCLARAGRNRAARHRTLRAGTTMAANAGCFRQPDHRRGQAASSGAGFRPQRVRSDAGGRRAIDGVGGAHAIKATLAPLTLAMRADRTRRHQVVSLPRRRAE